MVEIKNRKPVKVGESYYFTIPKQYIDNGLISIDDKYDLDVDKVKNNGNHSPQ